MPSFPSHWAGISGTIELSLGETPFQAAQRELEEETNLDPQNVQPQGGLYVNVPYISPRTQQERLIRVYPFVVPVPSDEIVMELRGTEHDGYKFVTLPELEALQKDGKCVPGLVQAFHHATYGKYDSSISDAVREWAKDKENGASVMTRNALELLWNTKNDSDNPDDEEQAVKIASQISMLRPSMVPIVNVMHQIINNYNNKSSTEKTQQNPKAPVTMESFQSQIQECVSLGVLELIKLWEQKQKQSTTTTEENNGNGLTIATFSRSGTLAKILQQFLQMTNTRHRIICSQSTPGNEGELMAQDVENAEWIPDHQLLQLLSNDKVDETAPIVDVVLVGCDCLLQEQQHMVNKVGTKVLCETAQKHEIPVYACCDRWKLWDDLFPPPLEQDLFELIPGQLLTKILVPEENTDTCEEEHQD